MERLTTKTLSIWKGEVDLTTGNLFVNIIRFTLPIIASSVVQLLYFSIGLMVLSRWGGGNYSMAAVGNNGSLISLIVNTFLAISVGANVVVARYKGQKNKEKAMKSMNSSMILAVIIGVTVAVFGYFMARHFLAWMQTPAPIIDLAADYLRIYFIGVPFLTIFTFGTAILRSLGDSKRPLWALFFCAVLNVGMNLLFVIVFHWDVEGVAWTLVISEFIEAMLIVIFLMDKRYGYVRMLPKEIRLYKDETREVLQNGIPAGVESLIFSISNVIIQAEANTFNASSVTGNAASDNIEGYVFAILEALAVSLASVSAQNYGANNKDYLKKAIGETFSLIVGFGILFGVFASVFRQPLISLFITDGQSEGFDYAEAMSVGTNRLVLMGLTYFLCAMMDGFSGYLRGLGHPLIPTVVTLFCATFFRVFYVFVPFHLLADCHNLVFLYCAYPVSWALADVTYSVVLPFVQKKAYREIDAKLSLERREA
jgi:putative MATE family efflux protein